MTPPTISPPSLGMCKRHLQNLFGDPPHFSITDNTCVYRDSITSENWIANGTLSNGTSVGSLYLTPGGFQAVGVREEATASSFNETVTGFGLFATQLVYNNDSTLESQFWAQATVTDGIYALMWNMDGDLQDNSFPVTVKAVENTS